MKIHINIIGMFLTAATSAVFAQYRDCDFYLGGNDAQSTSICSFNSSQH